MAEESVYYIPRSLRGNVIFLGSQFSGRFFFSWLVFSKTCSIADFLGLLLASRPLHLTPISFLLLSLDSKKVKPVGCISD